MQMTALNSELYSNFRLARSWFKTFSSSECQIVWSILLSMELSIFGDPVHPHPHQLQQPTFLPVPHFKAEKEPQSGDIWEIKRAVFLECHITLDRFASPYLECKTPAQPCRLEKETPIQLAILQLPQSCKRAVNAITLEQMDGWLLIRWFGVTPLKMAALTLVSTSVTCF